MSNKAPEQFYKTFLSNNDYDTTGTLAEHVIDDLKFELTTGMRAALVLNTRLTKAEALKEIDNLRWLVEQLTENQFISSDQLEQ